MEATTRGRTNRDDDDGVAIWGGVECTVNRVGDEYFDQLERNGHARRLDDLRAFADLGIRTLRFPILWERTAPDGLASASWRWADERMELMRELGIRPIVGLVHHGSGPRSTDLLDPGFPQKLAEYARAVAERYPWVEHYTPVNEPLTTARFSGLYGVWYPHARNDRSFVDALLNECGATSMAMREIRAVNPGALLVQTEDLGRTHCTPALRYQARFENHRRWLSFDLLAGAVDEAHPLWKYLRYHLQESDRLEWMRDNPSPADIIGLNYYVTSERYLDERLERYPGIPVGGNRRHRYVDIEAVRVLAEGLDGPEKLLREAWERYRTPIAVTEAHIGCVRSEQVRWFREIYDAARALRSDGVDIRAVTAWALLGTYDWHCLVTRCEGFYEPGVFDVRNGELRPTALATMIRALNATGTFDHPLADMPGWWRRPERLLYDPVEASTDRRDRARAAARRAERTAVIDLPDELAKPANGHDAHEHGDNRHLVTTSAADHPAGNGFANGSALANGSGNGFANGNGNGNTNGNGHANGNGNGRANGSGHANGHGRATGGVRAPAHPTGVAAGGDAPGRPLLVTGATGTLGRAFAQHCRLRGIPYRLVSRAEMDITDRDAIARMIDELEPWALVNTAGYVRVDDAQREREQCLLANAEGPALLAGACAARGLPLVTFSSDLVFDGESPTAYRESAATRPLNVYGESKAIGEQRVLAAHPDALVIRTSAFFGPWDEHNFVTLTLRSLAANEPVIAANDTTVSPTYVPDLVDEAMNLLIDGERGIWHLANRGAVTWYELATMVAKRAGHSTSTILGRSSRELGLLAPRPRYTPLSSERGELLPTLEHAVSRYFGERRDHVGSAAGHSARVVQAEA